MVGYLSAGIICSEKRTVFQERSLRKTVSYVEQIMVNEKIFGHSFAPNGAYEFVILQIFFAMRAVLKIDLLSFAVTWTTLGKHNIQAGGR